MGTTARMVINALTDKPVASADSSSPDQGVDPTQPSWFRKLFNSPSSDLAAHEASHVVAAFAQNGYLMRVYTNPGYTQGAVSIDSPEAQAKLYYAGGAGNALLGGGSAGDYSDGDIEFAQPYLAKAGWTQERAIDEATALLNRPERIRAIEAIRDALVEKGSIDGHEAVDLARQAGMDVADWQGSYEGWVAAGAPRAPAGAQAKRNQLAPVGMDRPAPLPLAQPAAKDNLVAFPSKKRGRPKKIGMDPKVNIEQVSKYTHVVRIRWFRPDGIKDGVVVNRLRDTVVKEIKRTKKRYEQFKETTLASWKPGTVRESHETGTDPERDV